MNESDILLRVRGLSTKLQVESKTFTVVNNLSFDLKRGETLALVGESGCGKSMTALSIMGILPKPPTLHPTGEILYQGKNLLTMPESAMQKIRGAKIAMIFQDPLTAFNPVYTIGSQLSEMAKVHLGLSEEAARSLILATLEEVSLPNPAEKILLYPHQMSGGMLQRAMIAMAILCKPDILIADEPTTALDVTVQAQILSALDTIKKNRGMSILLITHDMGVVAEIADKVAVMYASEIIETGDIIDIFDNPSHPYTQALFQVRSAPKKKGRLATIQGSVPSLATLPAGCRFSNRCSYKMEICQGGRPPPAYQLSEPGHVARCWLFDKNLKETMKYETENT